jgi:pimeloyl-ACP methyl ester carboxylesterase
MRIPLRGRHRGVALAGVLCAALGLVSAPAAGAPAPEPGVPQLDWRPCAGDFFCATAVVPLDYANPAGDTIRLAMIKRPATDPAHRIGSLFFNPGGPGESGVERLPTRYQLFPAALRARFDIVSFDPRGIGRSAALRCFEDSGAEQRLLAGAPAGYPIGAAEQRSWDNAFAEFDKSCAAHAGPLLAHDTTADVARDLDLMRQAVGDPALNYVGISYGSYLGATYANLFPGRVRAITLDGDVDPVQWSTGTGGTARWLGTPLRLGSDRSSAATLDAFLDRCGRAAVSACAFSAGSPAATHAKFDALLERVSARPVTVLGTTFTKAVTMTAVLELLQEVQAIPSVSAGWPGLAALLQAEWTRTTDAPPTGAPGPAPSVVGPDTPWTSVATPPPGLASRYGVACTDSANPRVPAEYAAQAAFATARSGVVGPHWAWIEEACAQWPVRSPDRYTGPWNRPTAAPILLVANTVDPATPYHGAVALSHDLANARLLTVDGFGHTAFTNHSACVDAFESAYFVTGALPGPGAVCQQDQPPFPG